MVCSAQSPRILFGAGNQIVQPSTVSSVIAVEEYSPPMPAMPPWPPVSSVARERSPTPSRLLSRPVSRPQTPRVMQPPPAGVTEYVTGPVTPVSTLQRARSVEAEHFVQVHPPNWDLGYNTAVVDGPVYYDYAPVTDGPLYYEYAPATPYSRFSAPVLRSAEWHPMIRHAGEYWHEEPSHAYDGVS